jgi:hypothetical protein
MQARVLEGETMPTDPSNTLRWSTASFGHDADTLPGDLRSLGQHLDACKSGQGGLFVARRLGDALHAFTAPRLMTTVVVALSLLSSALLIW